MFTPDVIGHWLAIFITIATLSYLYDDNPIYKLVEHIFVGTSIGYVIVRQYKDNIAPNLIERLTSDAAGGHRFISIVPLVLALCLFARYVPRLSWLGRIPIAFVIGVYAGQNVPAFANSNLLAQLSATVDAVHDAMLGRMPTLYPTWATVLGLCVLVLGLVASLLYFFFSIEHKGPLKPITRVGVWVMMIGFGASFGYTVQGRISLAIGRAIDCLGINLPADEAQKHHSGLVSLIAMAIVVTSVAVWKRSRATSDETKA